MPQFYPLTHYSYAVQAGILPIREGPVRFAVGQPNGLTSNSWKIWTTRQGDIYITCRDNFREAKVSLHASGRWRMGFTVEAIDKNKSLVKDNQDRAWDVWDTPAATLPDVVTAFHLYFPTSELAVRQDQRQAKEWKDVIHIEEAPPGWVTIVTLFVTLGDVVPRSISGPSYCLASLGIGNGRRAQLVYHGAPEGDLSSLIRVWAAEARRQTEYAGLNVPSGAYSYFFGHREDKSRFIVGALVEESESE